MTSLLKTNASQKALKLLTNAVLKEKRKIYDELIVATCDVLEVV